MFSFKQVKERFVSPHTYLQKEESDEEEGENVESMDTNPVEEAPFEQYVFPPSRYQEVIQHPQHFYIKRQLIPSTLLPLPPSVLNGLEAIDGLTGPQKATASVYTALPIVVHHSPLVALFLDHLPPECRIMPKKQRYINWTQSVFQLRCFIPLILEYALPFHSSVSNEYPQECFNEFLEQIKSYEEMHQQRVENLFAQENLGNILNLFMEYCVDFSFYYIHSLERFIYKVLIEPHLTNLSDLLTFDHLLTPVDTNVNVSQCENKEAVLKCIVDFFQLKVLATQKNDMRHAGDDYVFRNPFRLDLIETRVRTAPQNQLYMGCLDSQTLKEYLEFSNPKINLV
jgi:hypothetical protein